MSKTLIPHPFWFRWSLRCLRVDSIPNESGRPIDLPQACSLPATALLGGELPWVDVRVGWNPRGLGLSFESSRAAKTADDPSGTGTNVQIWIDTRDARDIHRGTRFCHRFDVELAFPNDRTIEAALTQKPIARALADAPSLHASEIQVRAERIQKAWRVDIFIPSESLHGFDHETNRRLGFNYQVSDPVDTPQNLGVGREFPIGEDPSLWATLDLVDTGPPQPNSVSVPKAAKKKPSKPRKSAGPKS